MGCIRVALKGYLRVLDGFGILNVSWTQARPFEGSVKTLLGIRV